MPADLDDVVEALNALTRALTPVLTPALRPTWDQQRWQPGADAFGDVGVAPTGVDSGGWPTNVAPNELIESAWGNAVVKGLAGVRIDGGHASTGPNVVTGAQSVLDVTVVPNTLPYPTRMFASTTMWLGNTSNAITGISGQINTQVAGTNMPPTPATGSMGGAMYGVVPMQWKWDVPANSGASYSIICNWNAGPAGTFYAAAQTIFQRYRK